MKLNVAFVFHVQKELSLQVLGTVKLGEKRTVTGDLYDAAILCIGARTRLWYWFWLDSHWGVHCWVLLNQRRSEWSTHSLNPCMLSLTSQCCMQGLELLCLVWKGSYSLSQFCSLMNRHCVWHGEKKLVHLIRGVTNPHLFLLLCCTC